MTTRDEWNEVAYSGLKVFLDDEGDVVIEAVDTSGDSDHQLIIDQEMARFIATRVRMLVG